MPSSDSSPLIISQTFSERCRHPSLHLYLSGRRTLAGSTSDMAITHDDLSVRRRRGGSTDIGGKLSLLLVILSIICGVSAFVLSLAAESSRSEAAWFIRSSPDGGRIDECVYSGSGRTPLACALSAFLLLALAMFAEHAYMLVAVTNPDSTLASWAAPADPSEASSSYKALTWHACFLFLATWICFATAEVLLMIGIGVESGHLTRWRSMRTSCVVIRPGLFAAAGVLSLLTVFLGVGLYLTAMKTQMLHQDEERNRDEARGAHRQHWVAPGASQEPHVMGAQQSQPHLEGQYLSKTSTSV